LSRHTPEAPAADEAAAGLLRRAPSTVHGRDRRLAPGALLTTTAAENRGRSAPTCCPSQRLVGRPGGGRSRQSNNNNNNRKTRGRESLTRSDAGSWLPPSSFTHDGRRGGSSLVVTARRVEKMSAACHQSLSQLHLCVLSMHSFHTSQYLKRSSALWGAQSQGPAGASTDRNRLAGWRTNPAAVSCSPRAVLSAEERLDGLGAGGTPPSRS
jgi:hypothetical protein